MKAMTVAKKNLTRLFRKRVPLMTMVIGPMILVLLVGLAFSGTSEFAVTVGVFSEDYSSLTESLLGKLEEKGYTVQKEPMLDACIDSVKQRITNICVVFPANLGTAGSEIEFHADYSEVGLVNPILETLSSTVSATGDEISKELTEDILAKLSSAEEEINRKVPIIVKLFTQNDKLRGQTETIIEQLNGIDLSINVAEMRSEEIAAQFQALHAITVETIIAANDLVISLEEDMNRLAITDADMDDALHVAAIDFEKQRRSLETTQSEINAIMGDVEVVVGATAEKLSDAKTAKRSVAKTTADIRDTLTSTLDELNALQASLNDIKKSVTSIEIDAATIVNPITTSITPIAEKKTHFNYLFPTLVMIIIMITGVLLGSTMVVEEKNSGEFFRTAISPTGESTFLFGALIAALAVIMVQTSIFMLIASLFFDVSLLSSLFTTSLSLVIMALLFITIGIFIGVVFRDRESATLSAIILSTLFLLFSGVLLPIEGMTEIMRTIAMLNPLVIGQRLLAQSIFFGFGLTQVGMTLLKLSIVGVVIFFGSVQVSLRMRAQNMARIKYGDIEELRSKWNTHIEIWLEKIEPALANFTPMAILALFTGRKSPRASTTYFDDAEDDDVKEFKVLDSEEAALIADSPNPEDDPRCKKIDAEISRLHRELKKLG